MHCVCLRSTKLVKLIGQFFFHIFQGWQSSSSLPVFVHCCGSWCVTTTCRSVEQCEIIGRNVYHTTSMGMRACVSSCTCSRQTKQGPTHTETAETDIELLIFLQEKKKKSVFPNMLTCLN